MAQSIIPANEGWAKFVKYYNERNSVAGYGSWTVSHMLGKTGTDLVLEMPTNIFIGEYIDSNCLNYEYSNDYSEYTIKLGLENRISPINYLSVQLLYPNGFLNLFQVFHVIHSDSNPNIDDNSTSYITFGNDAYIGKEGSTNSKAKIARLNNGVESTEIVTISPKQIFSPILFNNTDLNTYNTLSNYTGNTTYPPFYINFIGIYNSGLLRIHLRNYTDQSKIGSTNANDVTQLNTKYNFMSQGAYGHMWYSINLDTDVLGNCTIGKRKIIENNT